MRDQGPRADANALILSTSSNPNPRPRRPPRSISLLLPLHFPPTSPHLRKILGLLPSLGRSAANKHQQNQHFPTIGLDWSYDEWTGDGRIGRNSTGYAGD